MRLLLNNRIVEIFSMKAIPTWKDSLASPEYYTVEIMVAERDGFKSVYLGDYNLDGTKETYNAAMQNFKDVLNHMTIHGYVEVGMFENFFRIY